MPERRATRGNRETIGTDLVDNVTACSQRSPILNSGYRESSTTKPIQCHSKWRFEADFQGIVASDKTRECYGSLEVLVTFYFIKKILKAAIRGFGLKRKRSFP